MLAKDFERVVQVVIDENFRKCVEALKRIRELAEWHFDPLADEQDLSPGDQTAHVNGLIVRECDMALEDLEK